MERRYTSAPNWQLCVVQDQRTGVALPASTRQGENTNTLQAS